VLTNKQTDVAENTHAPRFAMLRRWVKIRKTSYFVSYVDMVPPFAAMSHMWLSVKLTVTVQHARFIAAKNDQTSCVPDMEIQRIIC